nr:DUF6488 family protein [Sphingomonas turrisvirgatae]
MCFLAGAALIASPAMAHPDHDEEVQQQAPADQARQHIIRMVTQSKLPASWTKANLQGSSERTLGGARQTVVTFTNAAHAAARRTLRVVVNADGSATSTGPPRSDFKASAIGRNRRGFESRNGRVLRQHFDCQLRLFAGFPAG